MNVQTYSETRANFKAAIEQVNQNHEPLLITTKTDDAVLISREDYESMQETLHLLSSRNNANRLIESIEQLKTDTLISAELNQDGEYKEKANKREQ